MGQEDKVSIWLSEFSSEKSLNEFVKDQYDEDGDMYSKFMSAAGIDFYDSYKREALYFNGKLHRNTILDFSYAESFVDSVDLESIHLESYNAIILLYDFNYRGKVDIDNLTFIGVFDYTKSSLAE